MWLVTRAVSAVVLLVVARTQAANLWTPAAPSYAEYTGLMWDASWYREIAEHGYPQGLPRGADGAVVQNAWAFFPLFPALARAAMTVTGLSWQVVAPCLALLLSVAAALVVHQAVVAALDAHGGTRAGRHDRWLPLAVVAVVGLSAAAPVLQAAYTESLALLTLAGALIMLVRRRYVAAVPLVLALGLTRAVALALVVPVVTHAVLRLRAARSADPFPAPERMRLAALGLATVVSGDRKSVV